MRYAEFVKATVCNMSAKAFPGVRNMLGNFMVFSIIKKDDGRQDVFAEKLCDYFAFLEHNTRKDFDIILESYMRTLSTVSEWISGGSSKKGADVPRARKYYNKALSISQSKKLTMVELRDYSRFMLCLYAAIIKNRGKKIDDFDYSIESIDPNIFEISHIQSLIKRTEFTFGDKLFKKFNNQKEKKFERYSMEEGIAVIWIIMLWFMVNEKILGESV